MKKIIYLLIILFAPYSHGQSDENKRHEAYSAKIIDKNFFQQLDFIVDNVYKEKYNYYILYIWDKEKTRLDYKPNKSDSILYLSIKGKDTPMVYGFHAYYEIKYNNKIYFIGSGVDGILISKEMKKTYELSIATIKKNMHRDMNSPSLSLEYQDGKLIVANDSRINPKY